jgi:hypothetical protein
VSRWLASRFALTAEDARIAVGSAPFLASGHGELRLVRWLFAHFGLTLEDARDFADRATQSACRGDRPEVAYWLVGRFGLATEDVRYIPRRGAGSQGFSRWLASFAKPPTSPS